MSPVHINPYHVKTFPTKRYRKNKRGWKHPEKKQKTNIFSRAHSLYMKRDQFSSLSSIVFMQIRPFSPCAEFKEETWAGFFLPRFIRTSVVYRFSLIPNLEFSSLLWKESSVSRCVRKMQNLKSSHATAAVYLGKKVLIEKVFSCLLGVFLWKFRHIHFQGAFRTK